MSLSGIDIHSRAAPLYWSAGHPAAWRLAFLSQAGSFLRENAAVPCPASNAGVPINVEASAKPDACLPAFLRKATPGLQETWRGSLSLFFFFSFCLGPDCRKAGRCVSPEAPAQALLNCPAKLSAQRFSEPRSGVIKSPPELRSAPDWRATQGRHLQRAWPGRSPPPLWWPERCHGEASGFPVGA